MSPSHSRPTIQSAVSEPFGNDGSSLIPNADDEVGAANRKFVELVIYVAGKLLEDRAGGPTKSSKVLYFAEFSHVRQFGRPISGVDYYKCANGPVPRPLRAVRNHLVTTGQARLENTEFLGYRQHRLVPQRPADLAVFDSDELATIDRVIEQLAGLTAVQVSDLARDEPGWKLARDGETIPYAAALIPKQQVSTPTGRRLAAAVASQYGIDPAE